jgi:hypothetical protein
MGTGSPSPSSRLAMIEADRSEGRFGRFFPETSGGLPPAVICV